MKRLSDKRDDDEPKDSGGSYSYQYNRPQPSPKQKPKPKPEPESSEKPSKKKYEARDAYIDDASEYRHPASPEPKKKKKKKSKKPKEQSDLRFWLGIVGMLILIFIGMNVVFYIMGSIQEKRIEKATEKFQPDFASYTKPPVSLSPAKKKFQPIGKFVLIDIATGKLDPFHLELDTDLRAENASEVGTIVQLRWESRIVGKYSGGGAASQWLCHFQLVDNKTKIATHPKTFEGEPPPKSTKNYSDSGRKPTKEIAEYIRTTMTEGVIAP